ncbi:transcriptional regulator [Escherichia coli]|uniref:PapB/FocB family fimbrial expression transcriptional regulator n=1 Tax=Escherichia coli TaxID=562 RepID=UPI001302951E|nr:PapB/FocB family fimbrial expression transcriptional regulator [Escherichia coli]EJZ3074356.1 transcriptional regulator [Escherichia coli]KAE9821784.1 transcriptional regulator [Escherichia coli]MWK18055.1 transcriptional regulator [Escherichia coli]MWK86112.1 transcriptional regulator [Escherichia coli]MWL97025.1 transcriptional regulator [Escherichia coli]
MGNSKFFDKSQYNCIIPGEMPESQFWLLVEISPIHSERMIMALKSFFVDGYSRKEVCVKYNISPGYFSGALGRFHRVVFMVTQLAPYHIQLR